MTDDLRGAMSLDEPFPDPDPQPQATPTPESDDAEPEGVIVQGNQRLVDVSVLAAERKRVREATEKRVRETELTPLQQKAQEADRLRAALDEARPYVEFLRTNQHLLRQPEPTPLEQQIPDAEAEQEARDLQLYNAQSQLDIPTAKKIIARRRTETAYAARQAAAEAVAPMAQVSAKQASDMNFVRAVQMTDPDGRPLVDPEVLAQEWVALGPEMTQHPQVAEVVLERAMGKQLRMGRRPTPPTREPGFSEAPGGRTQAPASLTALDRRLGVTDKDVKGFQPGQVMTLGD